MCTSASNFILSRSDSSLSMEAGAEYQHRRPTQDASVGTSKSHQEFICMYYGNLLSAVMCVPNLGVQSFVVWSCGTLFWWC